MLKQMDNVDDIRTHCLIQNQFLNRALLMVARGRCCCRRDPDGDGDGALRASAAAVLRAGRLLAGQHAGAL